MSHLTTVSSILSRFTTAWATTGFPIAYTDVPISDELAAMIQGESGGLPLQPWARATIRTANRKQKSFGAGTGDARMFEESGVAFFEVYCPTGQGLKQSYQLCEIVKNAFEGVSELNGVWYRDPYISEAGTEGVFSHTNVIVEWVSQEFR